MKVPVNIPRRSPMRIVTQSLEDSKRNSFIAVMTAVEMTTMLALILMVSMIANLETPRTLETIKPDKTPTIRYGRNTARNLCSLLASLRLMEGTSDVCKSTKDSVRRDPARTSLS